MNNEADASLLWECYPPDALARIFRVMAQHWPAGIVVTAISHDAAASLGCVVVALPVAPVVRWVPPLDLFCWESEAISKAWIWHGDKPRGPEAESLIHLRVTDKSITFISEGAGLDLAYTIFHYR